LTGSGEHLSDQIREANTLLEENGTEAHSFPHIRHMENHEIYIEKRSRAHPRGIGNLIVGQRHDFNVVTHRAVSLRE